MMVMRALGLLRAARPPCQPHRPALSISRYGWLKLRPVSQLSGHVGAEQPQHLDKQPLVASNSAQSAERITTDSYREKRHFSCPACGQKCYRVPVLQKHLSTCCPEMTDLLSLKEWEAADTDEAVLLSVLAAVTDRESQQREKMLELTFRQRDSSGQRIRQDIGVVAAAMGLPPARAQRLLQFAMRAVPLAADYEPVEVIYEDADLVAVNKPPGVITAPKHRYVGGSMVNRIKGTLGYEPLTLHRLDMNTSGVVLFAKTRDVVPLLHAQFRNKEVRKEYIALSIGVPAESDFTVDAPIDRDGRDQIARCVASAGKPALTSFRVVSSNLEADLSVGAPAYLAAQQLPPRGASLIQCEPLTGRTHQIRVHLAHHGHPIVGDDVYGLEGPWIARQGLHAATLTVRHPRSGEPLRIQAPLPDDIRTAMRLLHLQAPE